MSLDELKGILAIGGGAVAVLLVFMLAMRLTPAWTQAVAGPGKPVRGSTIALLVAAVLVGAVLALFTGSPLGPLLLFQAGQAFVNIANAAVPRRRPLLALGVGVQAAAALGFAYLIYRHNALDVLKFVVPPVLLAGLCLWLLLRPPAGPAWLKVGLPAALDILVVAVLATLNHQWTMTALWLGLASGPLAVAWLRASAPAAARPDNNPPPAMEPTA